MVDVGAGVKNEVIVTVVGAACEGATSSMPDSDGGKGMMPQVVMGGAFEACRDEKKTGREREGI